MNTSVEGIIVNNCQYTPIYLIQDAGTTQANTYVITQNSVEQPKPVSNNLKTFYENSGNIENGIINTDLSAGSSVKKKDNVLLGNNLKLASFLLPKSDSSNKQYAADNIVLKPNITLSASSPVPVNKVPKIDIDRKIVRFKPGPEKVLPKIKPKENTPSLNQSKHTSVQLIKLGETYHSLNHLSNNQIKMVNQALKMINGPDKTAPEPTYDPVTNTHYIYKIVSPKDLTVVAHNKLLVKDKKLTKIPKRLVEEKIVKQVMPVKQVVVEPPEPEPQEQEAKVTRSGRKVKLPKQILPEDSPHKSKKKAGTIISCFQCSAEFSSLYRLQKHYENHPTHIPAKIHSNLFHCLLAIVKSGSEEDKTNIFIQQLEQLIVKLKSLLPCLLNKVNGTAGQPCTINDDIGRLFGMNPGKYNIDVEALNCVKDKNGRCIHNPPKPKLFNNDNKSSMSKQDDDMTSSESESENCARINSVAKWPTVSKRIWKLKQKTHELAAKKMRLKSEGDILIDLGTEDLMLAANNDYTPTAAIHTEDDVTKLLENPQDCNINGPTINESQTDNLTIPEPNKAKTNYIKFHSAHFDIRSSPIKSSSTFFRKFQINPSKMSSYQTQAIRSLGMEDKDHNKHPSSNPEQNVQNSNNNLHVTLPNTTNIGNLTLPNSDSNLHVTLPNQDPSLHVQLSNPNSNLHVTNNSLHLTLPSSENGLHVSLPNPNDDLHIPLSNTENSLHTTLQNSENSVLPSTDNSLDMLPNTDSLHDIFKDDVDLSCKEDSNIDPELKEWIISTSEKSQEALTKTDSLIEPAFLHVRDNSDKSIEKSTHRNDDMTSLDDSSRLLSAPSESVLNFLDTLGNDLVYPETEIRNNGVDFQLDLFTFHNS